MTDTHTDTDPRDGIDRLMRGATIATAPTLAIGATAPLAESLPAGSMQSLGLAVTVLIAYGTYLMGTSRTTVALFERLAGAVGVADR